MLLSLQKLRSQQSVTFQLVEKAGNCSIKTSIERIDPNAVHSVLQISLGFFFPFPQMLGSTFRQHISHFN